MAGSFLVALSKPEPTPGGGAAAAYGAFVGLALLEKIVRIEFERQQISSKVASLLESLLKRVSDSSRLLGQLRDDDGRAYLRFAQARSGEKGEGEIVAALEEAIESPIKIMEESHQGLNLASQAASLCKAHLLSDLLVVCELLEAAISGAYHIAQANMRLMASSSVKHDCEKRLSRIHDRSLESFKRVKDSILARQRL